MPETTTDTLEVPGVNLVYDVRAADGGNGGPPLMLIGSPMDASGFVTLAARFPDRTVMTYDPRGTARSEKTDAPLESTPEQHADDIHRIVEAVDAGPVDLFASSGGAVNALALVAAHPEDVRTLVAHEPPTAPRAARPRAGAGRNREHPRHLPGDGFGPAMAKFIALVGHEGPVPADFARGSTPTPRCSGCRPRTTAAADDALVGQNIITCTHYVPDFDALRAASTKIVVGVGAESEGEMARRGGEGVAELLGVDPVVFPGGHGGFLGDEYGQPGDPVGFAAKLREVLA